MCWLHIQLREWRRRGAEVFENASEVASGIETEVFACGLVDIEMTFATLWACDQPVASLATAVGEVGKVIEWKH